MKLFFATVMLGVLLCGCAFSTQPRSIAEKQSGYTYVPIDPFPVKIAGTNLNGGGVDISVSNLLNSLPDNAVRIGTETYDINGNVSYGPARASASAGHYKITVDYVNSDTSNIKLAIRKTFVLAGADSSARKTSRPSAMLPPNALPHSVEYEVVKPTEVPTNSDFSAADLGWEVYSIPLYIGIGLRVTADVWTSSGKVDIGGLGPIGAAAEVNQLRGSMVVQTLGVNGKSISAALPIQSELNRTTAQNAIVSVGAIKALLYSPETIVMPRIVGMYLPLGGDKSLVNGIISQLAREPVLWVAPTGRRIAE